MIFKGNIMLQKNNPVINYKPYTFNNKKVFTQFFVIISILFIVLASFIYSPYIVLNYQGYTISHDANSVDKRLRTIEDKAKKINKGDNYFSVWYPDFYTSLTLIAVSEDDTANLRKRSNLIINSDRKSNATTVYLKNVPAISCSGFADRIQERYGNVSVYDVNNKQTECGSIFSTKKYNIVYQLK